MLFVAAGKENIKSCSGVVNYNKIHSNIVVPLLIADWSKLQRHPSSHHGIGSKQISLLQ